MLLSAAASMPALLIGACGASAADLSYKDERPAIMSYGGGSWAGFYFGAQAGGLAGADNDLGSVRGGGGAGDGGGGGGATGANAAGVPSVGGAGGNGGDSFSVLSDGEYGNAIAGLHIGYNWQNANLVYGLEADIDANNSLDTLIGSVRARIGYASGRALFYATAGLAYLSVDDRLSSVILGGDGGAGGDGGTANGVAGGAGGGVAGAPAGAGLPAVNANVVREGGSEIGFVAGLGVEYKLTNQVGLGLEGLYYSFGDNNLGISNDGDFFSIRARLTMHLDRNEGDSLKDGYPSLADWRGFYVGAHAGAAFDGSDNSIDSVDSRNGGAGGNGGPGVPAEGDGCSAQAPCTAGGGGGGGGAGGSAVARLDDDMVFIGGVHLGYNWQSSAWVYGIEGDASFGEEKYSYLASARARLGYATGSYLFYATAGIAFAGVDGFSGIFANDGQDGADGSSVSGNGAAGAGGLGGAGGTGGFVENDQDLVGYVVGAGVDAKLSDRVTLGFEGLYYGFSGDSKTVSGDTTFTGSDDADVFVLRSRLSYSLSPHVEPLK